MEGLRCGRSWSLKVLAVKATAALRRRVPRRLDGYAVIVEQSGEIRLLDDP